MNIAQIVGDAPPVRCPYGEEITVEEVIHSYLTVMAWSEACRNESGLFTIQPPTAAPEGQRIASTELSVVDGLVVEIPTYEALPLGRREINKDLVMQRLEEASLVEAAWAALIRKPVLFGRWVKPEWQYVYADDPDMIAMLTAIGADVAAITAP